AGILAPKSLKFKNGRMNNVEKKYKGGRKPKPDPVVANYTVRFNAVDNARFLALFEKSGMKTKAHFIAARVFDETFKVIQINKAEQDYYSKLSTFYSQFRAVGVNYNQVVKALNTHFTEKKALAALYKLEKLTIEFIRMNGQIIELTQKYEQQWLQK
ncbi:MAG: conjugal transfer protein MobA, partial [Mariniphaga sp.]